MYLHYCVSSHCCSLLLLTCCLWAAAAAAAGGDGRDDGQVVAEHGVSPESPMGPVERDLYRAIQILHTKLDDDADGEVDDEESKKFLQADNNNRPADSTMSKLRYLHQDGRDRSISVMELWHSWRGSNVHNWTVDETVYWLVNYVELPEFATLFQQHSINGSLLPRLATDTHFISRLGITDPAAKHKISLKAMDVVLFGPPKHGNGSRLRDIVFSIVALVAFSSCCVFYNRSRTSQLAIRAMQEHLESLQKAEDQMVGLQQELNRALKAQEEVVSEKRNLEHQLEMQRQFSMSDLNKSSSSTAGSKQQNGDNISQGSFQDQQYVAKLEEEVKSLRDELKLTNDSLAAKKFRAPFALRTLLQNTYKIESHYYNDKKLSLEAKATEVKLRNQKLQKKKTSLFGYYKMAQENSLEEDINTIVEVKEAIMQVTREIKEQTERWKAIEDLCGCPLLLN